VTDVEHDIATLRHRLAGKVALVVGAGTVHPDYPGTGSATAMLMAAAGARVAVVGRTEPHTQLTCDRIAAAGGDAMPVLADATEDGECRDAVGATLARYGRLDILVNNLGLGSRETVLSASDADWERAFNVNLRSVVTMSRHALPPLMVAGRSSIINVSTIAAIRAFGVAPYSATKGALLALTQDMAMNHGPHGVRVNCIIPGHIYTPMGAGHQSEQTRALKRRASMLEIEGTGWDIGLAAVFLASDEARYITAIALPVDGGASASGPLAVAAKLMGGDALAAYGQPSKI
jgi:NAD(P)-dependent dehydrogenase (short-subunit alcohol dehydrogenase family)